MKKVFSHLAVAISFMVFARLFSFLFYGVVFHDSMLETLHLYRPMEAWQWKGLVGVDFLSGLAFSLIFSYLNRQSPFRFAIVYFVPTGGLGHLFEYMAYPLPSCILYAGWLTNFLTLLGAATVLYFLKHGSFKHR